MENQLDAWDQFAKRYKPKRNPFVWKANEAFDGCMFETYSNELKEVESVNPSHVWTLVEYDGNQSIVNGRLRVNRLGYFICDVPCSADSGSVIYDITNDLILEKKRRYNYMEAVNFIDKLQVGDEISFDDVPDALARIAAVGTMGAMLDKLGLRFTDSFKIAELDSGRAPYRQSPEPTSR